MANVEKQRKRLIKLLKELFQLDQPDLDFGFYKIMHAKADTISSFLEKDLLGIIQNAFGEADEAKVEKALLEYETMKRDAEELGAPNPEEKLKKPKPSMMLPKTAVAMKAMCMNISIVFLNVIMIVGILCPAVILRVKPMARLRLILYHMTDEKFICTGQIVTNII